MTYSLFNYNKFNKFNKMPPKIVVLLSAVTIFRQGNTSITESLDADLQMVIKKRL